MNAALISNGNKSMCNGDFREMTMQKLLGLAWCTPGVVMTEDSMIRCLAATRGAFVAFLE